MTHSIKGKLGKDREREREREYWVLAFILISLQSSAVKAYSARDIIFLIRDQPQRVVC